ncbi:glutaredoxin family protein [Candidatus Competibacter phosphatis]|uniref:Glutaredoxin family protein n=1 Tax=Candidatus Competibacter phosphatis TaxID=221280 RepID=A0ABX1TLB0_9GAMM|nr:glutaredoxin family protein [Candidatus Competibacter phosphatis]NMQ20203.1 glutaredoxin family protein [Candidatus Competibacter phosphatis]
MRSRQAESTLVLYMTSGCHLCEQAEALVRQQTAWVSAIEIVDDVELLERYGVRIPVLRRLDTGNELDWPFDVAGVQRLLSGYRPD